MSYRFLPFVRRGLAERIATPDSLGATIAARATFPVSLTLNTGQSAGIDLRVHGPGDVIGVDTRNIVRTEPPRFARNVAPDQFCAIEFDAPDFPWMFTPAAAGSNDRLRPWLVLVVVRKQDGVAVVVRRDRPLPQLVIEAPAVPGDELPDLAESWAWAHTQVVEDGAPASVAAHLAQNPELNVSRLLCPRRLVAAADYVAALVPAFEHGRLAGLGQQVPDDATTGPAWGAGGSVGATVTLPLYFHWEFRTGPAGDFESLARRLIPRPVPDTVGRRRMFIGDAHPALPALAADAGGIIELEGALRAPDPGSGPTLGPEHNGFVDALTEVLDAPANHVLDGASADAEAVAPPIYGGRHVQQERLAGSTHQWLVELNSDPRHRAAGGLGSEVVRLNQERFVQAAWEQVGDVLAANALLDRARFLQRVADRVHLRHVRPLAPESIIGFTAAVHERVPVGTHALSRDVRFSTLPAGSLGPAFRRIMSPRSTALVRAMRVAAQPGAVVQVRVVNELAAGQRQFDVLTTPPDGLVSSRLVGRFGGSAGGTVGPEIGAVGTAPAALLKQIRDVQRELVATPPPLTVALRPNLAKTGVLLPRQLDLLAGAAAGATLSGSSTSRGSTSTVAGLSNEVIRASLANPEAIGFTLPTGGRGVEPQLLAHNRVASTVVSSPVSGRGRPTTVARVETRLSSSLNETLREVVAASGPGTFLPLPRTVTETPTIAVGRGGVTVPSGRVPVEPGRPLPTGPLTPSIDPPVKQAEVVKAFVGAFEANRAELVVNVKSVIPAERPLDLGATSALLVAAIDPHDVIEARARLAVRVGTGSLHLGIAGLHLAQRTPLDPVMAAPDLPEPLYGALAAADPDRFLPGIGDIPDDTLTLLETNPRFVEAFMVGANHEMNRELLWRRYPTDRRATPFRRFWDRVDKAPDIPAIHEFRASSLLGTNSGADLRGSLVLLVRGQLLRRYPEAVVYAAPAKADGTFDPTPTAIESPVFWGRIAPDVTFVGFDLAREDVEPAPGWYFVIAEQPTAPRFGLDVATGGSAVPATWADLHWGHAGGDPGEHLSIAGSGLNGRTRPLISGSSVNATFGRNAADMAAITFQRPFRAVVHSSDVLDGNDGIGLGAIRPVLAKSVLLRPIALGGGG